MSQRLKWIGLLATTAIVAILMINVVREPDRQQRALADYQSFAIASGTDLYATNCARCHGAAGEGLGVYRALDQEFIVNKDPRDLHTVVRYGRYATDMAAFGLDEGGTLTPAQIDSLVMMLQLGSWERIAARVEALGLMPTEADILAATRTDEATVPEQQAADPAILAQASQLFGENCVECHGEQGEGTADAPQLNSAYVRGMPTAQLYGIIGSGVRNTKMEGFETRLTQDQIAGLIVFLQNWGNLDGQPGTGAGQSAESRFATEAEIAAVTQSGQELFNTWCGVCHGVRGEGGAIAPSLNDIPHLPFDFIVSRVRSGQNAMPPFPEANLSNGQLAVVIAYAQANIIGTGLPVLSAEEVDRGRTLYLAQCADCHGPFGEGVQDKGPALNVMPPMRASEIISFTRVGSSLTPAIPSSVISDEELRLTVAYILSW